MQVTVIGRHMDVPPELRDYVEKKLDKLPRFYDRVMMIEVIVEHDQNQNSVEIVVSVAKHREFVAQESSDDLYASFDICLDKIERQLRRHKDRIRNRKHPARPAQEGAE